MKRINPKTNKHFVYGDIRSDGKRFKQYLSYIRKDGTFSENWVTEEKYQEYKEKEKQRWEKDYLNRDKPGKKRLNPATGKEFSMGDIREDGYRFVLYGYRIRADGYRQEQWLKEESYHRYKIKNLVANIKRRNKNITGKKSDLTIDYLVEIFPKDRKCPALGIKMEWGGGKVTRNSPSLDRIDSSKGYIKGNVAWCSVKANSIKQDASSDEIIKVGKWTKIIENKN